MLFKFLRNLFLPKVKEKTTLASIKYVISKDNPDKAYIDLDLNDFDELSVNSLIKLLNLLGDEAFFIDTIDIIQNSLIETNNEELLIKIYTNIEQNIKNKIINAKNNHFNDLCVKPSDALFVR